MQGLSWGIIRQSSPFRSVAEAISEGLELAASMGKGHPNKFPSCGGMPLTDRVEYINSMWKALFEKLEVSPIASCFRRLPGSPDSWVCELWGRFFNLRRGVPFVSSHCFHCKRPLYFKPGPSSFFVIRFVVASRAS